MSSPCWTLLVLASLFTGCRARRTAAPAPREPVVLTDDGGWCWFQDPRVLAQGDTLLLGSVASGHLDPQRRGDVQLTIWDLASGARETVELADRLELDDHDAPALLRRTDGRWLAVYARHGSDSLVRWRVSVQPDDPRHWGPERTLETDSERGVTYSNLLRVTDGEGRALVMNVFRGEGWDPNLLVSSDEGESWRPAGRLLGGPGRPYLRYASDGERLHFVATEQHPRDFDNSVYHGFLRAGVVCGSGGRELGAPGEAPPAPEDLTRVFAGRADAVWWTVDLELDARGRPVVLASVQVDGAGLARGAGGLDHRFAYARFDGERWVTHEIAYAGTRLYGGEDDYTGLAAIDPDDVNVVFISSDAHPVSGAALISASDGLRHREIFRGRTRDGGASWEWTAVTRDSRADNLRPTVPAWGPERTALLWLRGSLRTYSDYDLAVVGLILETKAFRAQARDEQPWPDER